MMRPLRSRVVAVGAAVLVALCAASGAAAYWSGPGSGTGSVTAAAVQTISASPGAPSGQLFPGGQADVAFRFSNPNPFAVHFRSLSLDSTQGAGGFGVDGGHAGCNLATLGFTSQTNGGVGWTVPPKVGATDGSVAIDLPRALTMSAGAASSCQGATFAVHVTVAP